MMPEHGTVNRYNRGCKCIDCRCEANDVWAMRYRKQTRDKTHGIMLKLNLPAILKQMDVMGLTASDLEAISGIQARTFEQALKKGGMKLYYADRLACALGTHYSLIVRDDIVSIPHEQTVREVCRG